VVSFRYHVVSIAAVLLALAAGVILGAGPLAAQVNDAVGPAKNDPAVSADAALQKARVTYDDAWATAAAPHLVTGALHKQHVVVLMAPATPPAVVKAVTDELTAAGATITGQVQLTNAWFDAAQSTVLSGITDQLAPAGTKDASGTPAQRSAAALAAALVGKAGAPASDSATALLSGLRQGGFLTWSSPTPSAAGSTTGSQSAAPQAATTAVVLAPVAVRGAAAGLVPLATALDAAGAGVVVGGPAGSATAAGSVGNVRASAPARARVSTVDCVDLASGQVTVVLALAQQVAGGHGQYGTGPGADAPLPAP
jgi:hypothetical protein